jgi:hypothetical protein
MTALFVLGGIALFIIIVAIYFVGRYFAQQRTRNLKKLAELMNFTFSEKGMGDVQEALGGFHLFSQGYSRKISNVLTGMLNDIPVMVMDFRYVTGSGKNSHTWQQTVLAVESDRLQLPPFVLRSENLFDRIGGIFGKKDINFETSPVFSKRYLLRGHNEESIRKLFSDAVLQYFEQHPGLSTEGDGEKLIYYRISKRVPPEKIQAFLQEGYEVFGLFKSY